MWKRFSLFCAMILYLSDMSAAEALERSTNNWIADFSDSIPRGKSAAVAKRYLRSSTAMTAAPRNIIDFVRANEDSRKLFTDEFMKTLLKAEKDKAKNPMWMLQRLVAVNQRLKIPLGDLSDEQVISLLRFTKFYWKKFGEEKNSVARLYELMKQAVYGEKDRAVLFQLLKDVDDLKELGVKLQSYQFSQWEKQGLTLIDHKHLLGRKVHEKDTVENKILQAFDQPPRSKL